MEKGGGQRSYGIDLEEYREYALMECYADFLVHLEIYRPYHTKVKKKIADMLQNRMLLEAQKEKGQMFDGTDLQEYVKRALEISLNYITASGIR